MREKLLKIIDIRSKAKKILMTILLIIGVPVASSFILGYEMQGHQIQNIPTVVVDHDNSSFSRMLVDEIKNNEIFNIEYYSNSDYDVNSLIENEKARVGVIIPNSFSKDLSSGKAAKVLIFYDASQMSMTSAAKSRIDEILLTIKTGFLKKVMEGKLNIVPEISTNNVMPMYFTYRLIGNPTRNYVNFLLPGMLIAIIQVGLVMMGVDRVGKSEKYYSLIWLKGLVWGMLGALSIVITLGIQYKYFGIPYRGTLKGGLVLTLLFSIGMINFGILIRLLIPNHMLATQIGAVLVLPISILGGYTYPLIAMPETFQKIAAFFPFVHYAEPIRDLCIKPLGMEYVYPNIIWLLKFVIFMWFSTFIVFMIKKISVKAYCHLKGKNKGSQAECEVVKA